MTTMTVPRLSYGEVAGAVFERRLYVYVPEIMADGKPGFQPFKMWVVEGLYGRPFTRSAGRLDEDGFAKLRRSLNVRATPVLVARGDGSDRAKFTFARATYQVQILDVDASKRGAVRLTICR